MSAPIETEALIPPVQPLESPAQAPEVQATPEQDWKAEARKWEARAKENKAKADQFSALEDASKSDAQRREEAVVQAQRDAETARSEAVRYKVAATHGIPADHFELLGSGTEEEVTARAQKIAELISKANAPVPPAPGAPPTRPVEQLRPGATPSESVSQDDVDYAALFGPGVK